MGLLNYFTTLLMLLAINTRVKCNQGTGRIVYPAPRLVFLNPSAGSRGGQPLPNTAMGSRASGSQQQVVNPNIPLGTQQQNVPQIRVSRPGQSVSSAQPHAPRVRVIRPGSKVTSGNDNQRGDYQPRIIRPIIQSKPQSQPQPQRIRPSPSPTPNQVVIRPPPAIRGTRVQRPTVSQSIDRKPIPKPIVVRPIPQPSVSRPPAEQREVRTPRPVVVRPIGGSSQNQGQTQVQRQPKDINLERREHSTNQRPLVAVINPSQPVEQRSTSNNQNSQQQQQSSMVIDNQEGGGSIFINTDQLGFQGRQQSLKRGNRWSNAWNNHRGQSGDREFEMKAYPENYCDMRKYSDEQLAAYNMKRIEHYVANMSCSQYFFECAIGSTFLKNCTSDLQAFDVNLMNCNYKYNIRPCPEYDHIMHCTIREECTAEEFACCNSPQKCIPYAQRCDGVPDCSDGEDETNCPSCAADEFPCTKSDRCIAYSKRCDGVPDDCRDESNLDEYNCGHCSATQFQCSRSDSNYGTPCIDLDQRCNGVTDCPNGEDELNCKAKGPKYLLCENQKQSVNKAQWCDNVEDCLDGSDEIYCFYKK